MKGAKQGMYKTILSLFEVAIVAAVWAGSGSCQMPVDVEKAMANKQYLAALEIYEKMPRRRRTTSSAVAAAKSAWALGLSNYAKEEFDRAIELGELKHDLTPLDKVRIFFSKAVIEFQSGNFNLCIEYCESALKLLNGEGPLKGQILMLMGDSYLKLRKYAKAEKSYTAAVKRLNGEDKVDGLYAVAWVQYNIGKYEQASRNLKKIPLYSVKSPLAIRLLALIALEKEDFERLVFWLNKGKEQFPDEFLDSWVNYALMIGYIGLDQKAEVAKLRKATSEKYPSSDPWVILLNARAEEYEWENVERKARLIVR
ncbi:MAG: hypothetical protein D6808_04295 [Candidatus Dadabacteria bacterium]|nr:MAG: hypothetical protein D6808_04295 [Candidatus Dadabacteria bacterium]